MSTAGVISATSVLDEGNLATQENPDLIKLFEKLMLSSDSFSGSDNQRFAVETPSPIVIIKKDLPSENLASLMQKHHNKQAILNKEQCDLLALGCAQALQALHEKKIVHGKVNPWNFVVELNGSHIKVRLSDKDLSPLNSMKEYMAPELKDGISPTIASDIYAFGCVLNAFSLLNMGQRFNYLYKQMCNSKASKHPELRKPLEQTIEFLKNNGFAQLNQVFRFNK